ncbi:MAG: helix-turn-helix domain-containing protein [Anaerolineaceae bacterium]|jgi:AcrR family transcriptional regulator
MPRSKVQTEQIRAESRKKILATARRLFAERGYDGCNVSDIARQAEMSQGNVYWYFPSKAEILKTILVEGFTALGMVMAEAAAFSGSASQKIDYFLANFHTLLKEQGGDDFAAIVIAQIGQGGVQRFAELGLSTHQIGAGYHLSLNSIFAQGQAEGVIMPDIDPNLLSTFFFSFINGLMLMYPQEWKDIPYESIRDAVLRLLGADQLK